MDVSENIISRDSAGRRKLIPIGIENFKEFKERNYYYVDKTRMVKDIIDNGGKVNLFTRPRRFGKTLILSMIRTFFEDERDKAGRKIDNRHYFDGMKIMDSGEAYTSEMGQYPVIKMSLKSAKQPDFEMAYDCLREEIIYEYERHEYVLKGDALSESNKELYHDIMTRKAAKAQYATAIKFLSQCLECYHNKKVIILIDEYDVPLENSYFRGFYDRMIDFIRSLFESALKTNDALEYGVITGCLRISRESIFTGLNNLKINSILNNNYAEYFGFTGAEVECMLDVYGLSEYMPVVKQWYDGYIFGKAEVYNPWSIINYVDAGISGDGTHPRPYWSNTSSNNIIKDLVERADSAAKAEIEQLIDGKTIEKKVHEDITYEDIHKTQDNLWNFLFFTGYLKMTAERFEGRNQYLMLKIPNEEVAYIYSNTIKEWFDREIKTFDLPELHKAVISGDEQGIQKKLKSYLQRSISYYDNKEAFYHGIMVGLLGTAPGYRIQSNRESGDGRPDIVLAPLDEEEPVIILELKCCKKYTEMADGCRRALAQIEEKNYAEPFLDKGYTRIMKCGMCFCEKTCMVKVEKGKNIVPNESEIDTGGRQ